MSKQELDFIVIGAQKAGTTTLFEYLRRHPEICLPAAKEVPYFSHDRNYNGDWSQYLHKAFTLADPDRKWGTVTPHYMVGGLYERMGSGTDAGDERTVPLRIQARLPDVRLIAILRDPVQRARSHHAMATMNGWDRRSFAEAIDDLLRPDALARARRLPEEATGYVTWGEYGRILAGYLDVFAREQLLVLYTEDLKQHPEVVLGRVFDFLGVAADFIPDNIGTTYRPSAAARRVRWLDLNAVQAAVAANPLTRRVWHALPERSRRGIDKRFDRMNYLTDLWNRRPGQGSTSIASDTLRALRDHYERDAERLSSLLGEAAPWLAISRAG